MLKVFVYGTLKPGEVNYPRYCAGKVVEAQRAYTYGKLFSLPLGYPAMTTGNNHVHGYLLAFADSNILFSLDQLEDYDPARPAAENEYNRQQIEIYALQGHSLGQTWAYLMSINQVYQMGGILQPDGWWSSCGNKC
ncbi:MAG: gamma-glutamylcyclotransferase [Nostocaceae cyanobacterium]|nr:gamma-glutamylcyclotransferase [Nostocaceae cyanobacterium]